MNKYPSIIKNMEKYIRRFVPNASFSGVFRTYEKLGPRENGAPSITHPINVAKKVSNFFTNDPKRNTKLITVAMLHDTLEDTNITYDDLKKEYGQDIADCVQELTNPPHLSFSHQKGEYILSRMRVMSDDALIVKLADRLDNLETLGARKPDKITSTLRDTEVMLDGICDGQRELLDEQKLLILKIRIEMTKYCKFLPTTMALPTENEIRKK